MEILDIAKDPERTAWELARNLKVNFGVYQANKSDFGADLLALAVHHWVLKATQVAEGFRLDFVASEAAKIEAMMQQDSEDRNARQNMANQLHKFMMRGLPPNLDSVYSESVVYALAGMTARDIASCPIEQTDFLIDQVAASREHFNWPDGFIDNLKSLARQAKTPQASGHNLDWQTFVVELTKLREVLAR